MLLKRSLAEPVAIWSADGIKRGQPCPPVTRGTRSVQLVAIRVTSPVYQSQSARGAERGFK